MFKLKMTLAKNSLAVIFLLAAGFTLMGAGYMIPEAGYDGRVARMNQYGKDFMHSPGQVDRNNDGRIDLIVADRNGDGVPDYWATDRDYDGKFDDYQYDRNFDGKIDQWEYDLDQDGISDKIYVDSDGDEKAELFAVLNPVTRTYTWYGSVAPNTGNQNINRVFTQAPGTRGNSY